uniref:tetratricopeptide repeat protein n=1 Tax=Fulvivirga sp. TaxID=1931237 RepID=UPI004049837F
MRSLVVAFIILFNFSLIHAQDWRTLYSDAQQEYNNGNLASALLKAKNCLKNYQSQDGTFNSNYESILRMLSNFSFEAGEYESGLEYSQKELSVRDQIGNTGDLEYAVALYNKGSFLEVLNKSAEALQTFESALNIFQQFYESNNPTLIECEWKVAASNYALKNTDKAFEVYNRTIEAYDISGGITMDYVNAIFNYSNILIDMAQYDIAFNYLLDLKDIYEQFGDGFEADLALINTNKGLCLHKSGKYVEAEEAYLEADNLYRLIKEENSSAYYNMINLRAVNFEKLGDTNRAAELLAMIGESGNAEMQSSAKTNEAMLLIQQGDIAGADKLLTEALAGIDKTTDVKTYFEILLDLTQAKILQSKLEEANPLVREATDLQGQFSADEPLTAKYFYILAEYEDQSGDWNNSYKHYNEALALLEKNNINSGLYLNILGALAVHYQETGNYQKSEDYINKQLAILTKIGQTSSMPYATILNNLGTVKQNQADFIAAAKYLEDAEIIVVKEVGKNSKEYAGIIENLALTLTQLGEYSKAEELINECIVIRKSLLGESHPLYANAIQNLGRVKQFKGKYQEAEPLFGEATKLKKELFGTTHPEYANALNNSALLFQTMGNYEKAEPLFIEASDIYQKRYGDQHPEYATTLENLATLYKLKGQDQKALTLLDKTLAIDKNIYGENHPRYAITLHNLASIYKDLDQTEQARSLYEQALTIDKNVYGSQHPAYASTLYNLAVLNQQLIRFDEAENNFKECLEIRKSILGENHPDYAYSLYGLAGLYHAIRKYDQAKSYYDQVIINYLQQIKDFFPSLSENEKGAFYAKIKPVLESYQDFCVEYALSGIPNSKNIIGELFNLQLSTKALLLHSSNKVRNRIFDSGNTELINEYVSWTESKEKLSKFLAYSDEQLAEQNINITDLANEINNLEKSLSQKSELFAGDVEQKSYTWKDVQNVLKEQEAALEIIRIKKRYIPDSVMYVALILKKASVESPEMVILKDGKRLEKRYFNYYRNAIKFAVGDDRSFEEFWKPVDDHLDNMEQVFASTDGIFNKININTLWNTKIENYVIDEYNVRNISNTREIVQTNTQPVGINNTAEVFGNPDFNLSLADFQGNSSTTTRASEFGFTDEIPDLPGTKIEVNKLSELLAQEQWTTNLYLREEANEKKIKAISPPKLLHVATHGFFKSDVEFEQNESYDNGFNHVEKNPLFRSGLLLAGSAKSANVSNSFDEEDGVLTAYEAMNLNLDNTELVVLSACETGIGEVRNGEGVYGLQRSFMVAGAKSVIMSLWQVDDNTTQKLMINFYKNWLSGKDKFESFKLAQRELKSEYADPFHWGAFIILGTE